MREAPQHYIVYRDAARCELVLETDDRKVAHECAASIKGTVVSRRNGFVAVKVYA